MCLATLAVSRHDLHGVLAVFLHREKPYEMGDVGYIPHGRQGGSPLPVLLIKSRDPSSYAKTARVVVVDDHRAVRELLVSSLRQFGPAGYEVGAEGGAGQEAVDLCVAHRPDLLVLDVVLPGFSGVEVLHQVRRRMRGLRVVFFSGCTQEQLIAQAVALGADAYVLKSQPLQTLVDAIETVRRGGKYFDPTLIQMNSRMAIFPGWQILTAREQQVARLVAEGKSTKEAAAILGISAKTLDKHRSSMMQNLNLHDAVSVTRYAIIAGLTSLD